MHFNLNRLHQQSEASIKTLFSIVRLGEDDNYETFMETSVAHYGYKSK
jgi:hypothetical protein